jgi:hypothetical protein
MEKEGVNRNSWPCQSCWAYQTQAFHQHQHQISEPGHGKTGVKAEIEHNLLKGVEAWHFHLPSSSP